MTSVSQQISIRAEKPSDYNDIRRINDLAFGQSTEGILVEKLRLEAAYIRDLSLVAVLEGKIIGHILFFPVNIVDHKQITPSLSLAPMGVDPEYQKMAVGTQLVKSGLGKAKDAGFGSVVVVGHPEYYPRFGFKPASEWEITSPWELPAGVFMAIELNNGALEGISGKVIFSSVFNDAI